MMMMKRSHSNIQSKAITLTVLVLAVWVLISCNGSTPFSNSRSEMNWHLFRGNAKLSGYSELFLPEKPVLQWTYKADVRTVSSPVIDEGTTYWCDKKGMINGVNIKGQLVFAYNLSTAVEATPLIHDSVIYIGRIDGILSAISLAKKDTLWNFATEGQISASPNITTFKNQTAIIVGSYDNYMYCINALNGTLITRFRSGYYLNGAAALWNKYVLFGGCDAWLRIIDGETGEATDSLETNVYIPCSPAIMGNICYLGDYNGNIYELMLKDGKIAQHKKLLSANKKDGSFVSVPAISGEDVCFFSDERNLVSINRQTGKTNWKFMLKGNVGESAPVICRDKIIVCTKTGIVTILDANTGEQTWEYDTGEPIVASPAIIKNHFMILTTKGTLFCFGEQQKNEKL